MLRSCAAVAQPLPPANCDTNLARIIDPRINTHLHPSSGVDSWIAFPISDADLPMSAATRRWAAGRNRRTPHPSKRNVEFGIPQARFAVRSSGQEMVENEGFRGRHTAFSLVTRHSLSLLNQYDSSQRTFNSKPPIGAVMVVGGGIAGMQSALDLRKDVKGFLAGQTIDREAAPIQRKDLIRLQVFAQRHERGVGEIHQHIMIFLHQSRDALQALTR